MPPILRKVRAISVSRTARVFVDGGASIGISVMFGLSSLPNGYRFKRPVYRRLKELIYRVLITPYSRCSRIGVLVRWRSKNVGRGWRGKTPGGDRSEHLSHASNRWPLRSEIGRAHV